MDRFHHSGASSDNSNDNDEVECANEDKNDADCDEKGSLIYLGSKCSLEQMRKALTNISGPAFQQVRLYVSETIAGEERDQPMRRPRTFLDDLANGGDPVGHHPSLPLPDVVVGVEEEVDGELDRLGVQLLLLLRIAAHWSAIGTCKLKKT